MPVQPKHAHELRFAGSGPEGLSNCHRLSDLFGTGWQDRRNPFNETPQVDFGLSEPFQLYAPESAAWLRETALRQLDTDCKYTTARTSCCVRGCDEMTHAIQSRREYLERAVSSLAGVSLKMHPLRIESSHVNVQTKPQTKPVDNWHFDSTPFVLVTVLTDHSKDAGGSLLVKKTTDDDNVYRCKLEKPGCSVLMQGSHIEHCAQQSVLGQRLTLVTSFVVESPFTYDSTSLRVALAYSPPASTIWQFLEHSLFRLEASASEVLERRDSVSAARVMLAEGFKLGRLAEECAVLVEAGVVQVRKRSERPSAALAALARAAALVHPARIAGRSAPEEGAASIPPLQLLDCLGPWGREALEAAARRCKEACATARAQSAPMLCSAELRGGEPVRMLLRAQL